MGGNCFYLNDRVEAPPTVKLNINNREGLKSCSELRCCSSYAFRNRSNLTVFRGQEPDDSVSLAQFLRTQNHGLIPVTPDHLPIFTFAARAGSQRHKIALGAEATPSAICLCDFRSHIVRTDSVCKGSRSRTLRYWPRERSCMTRDRCRAHRAAGSYAHEQ